MQCAYQSACTSLVLYKFNHKGYQIMPAYTGSLTVTVFISISIVRMIVYIYIPWLHE